jgi:hypothetical protein
MCGAILMVASTSVDAAAPRVSLQWMSTCGNGPLNYAFSGAGWIVGSPGQDLRYGSGGTPFNARAWIDEWRQAVGVNGDAQVTNEALGELTV